MASGFAGWSGTIWRNRPSPTMSYAFHLSPFSFHLSPFSFPPKHRNDDRNLRKKNWERGGSESKEQLCHVSDPVIAKEKKTLWWIIVTIENSKKCDKMDEQEHLSIYFLLSLFYLPFLWNRAWPPMSDHRTSTWNQTQLPQLFQLGIFLIHVSVPS